MISKAMVLGAAAAAFATGGGYYIAHHGLKMPCDGGCPIQAMLGSKAPKPDEGSCGSCCGTVSKSAALTKPTPVETPTLAACVGGPAYATHSQPVTCCDDE